MSNIEQPGSRSERILSGVEPGLRSAFLVADDEVEILGLVISLMEAEGYLVLPASRLNGTDLCSRLLEEGPGIMAEGVTL